MTSNASAAVIFLFPSSSVTISGYYSDWLASSTTALLVSITSATFLLLVSCFYSTIRGSIADKDVTTSMSKSMYSSMTVSEKSWSNNSWNSASIWLYFLRTQKPHALHCLLLKNIKVQIEKSQ